MPSDGGTWRAWRRAVNREWRSADAGQPSARRPVPLRTVAGRRDAVRMSPALRPDRDGRRRAPEPSAKTGRSSPGLPASRPARRRTSASSTSAARQRSRTAAVRDGRVLDDGGWDGARRGERSALRPRPRHARGYGLRCGCRRRTADQGRVARRRGAVGHRRGPQWRTSGGRSTRRAPEAGDGAVRRPLHRAGRSRAGAAVPLGTHAAPLFHRSFVCAR